MPPAPTQSNSQIDPPSDPPAPSDQVEALWSLQRCTEFLFNRTMQRAGYRSISLGSMRVLVAVSKGAEAKEISRRFNCTQQYISKLIHSLHDSELIELRNHSRDGRRVAMTVTDQGWDALRLLDEWQTQIAQAVGVDLVDAADRLEELARNTSASQA